MKRAIGIILLSVIFLSSLLGDTEETLSFSGEGETPIPRRVYFDLSGESPSEEIHPIIQALPDLLYESISSHTPIVKVADEDSAHNSCRIRVSGKIGGDTAVGVEIELIDGYREGKTVFETSYLFKEDLPEFETFLKENSIKMARHLPLVTPRVEIVTTVETEEERKIVREVSMIEELKRPLEFSFFMGGLTKDLASLMGLGSDYSRFSLWPLQISGTYYFGRGKNGLTLSFMADYFDADVDGKNDWFLFPGFGYTLRSFNRFSAYLDITLFPGFYFTGKKSYFFMLLGISPSISYNITPSFAVSLRLGGLFIEPMLFIGKSLIDTQDLTRNRFSLKLLNLGIIYRPDL